MTKKTSKILLLTTGGTIASRPGEGGLAPSIGAKEILDAFEGSCPEAAISYEELLNLDSANVQPEHWQIIARRVFERLSEYDGIVVTHGTDTMAYTAAALSFMLRNLRKSVVLTGSQMPIDEPGTDAISNLHTAVSVVLCGIAGVTLAFDRLVINGVRAVKSSTVDFGAFESVNAPPMGILRADGMSVLSRSTVRVEDGANVILDSALCPDVFLLKLVPGTKPEIFQTLLDMGYRGIVIEAFGLGGVHCEGRDLIAGIKKISDAGIPVVVCSQCLHGPSDLSVYEVGTRLLDAGVIQGADMTTESAVVKLMWALGKTKDRSEIAKIFAANYAGESGGLPPLKH
ncbi:MAG: asparaginase [Synergistaceae bacterium]|jgi:L-asparaginase|nr:asparaginase [Synergistaceae bacterium]